MSKAPPDPLFVIRGDTPPVHCLLFHNTSNEETLYMGTEDGTVHIWDLKSCKRKHILQIGSNTCLSLYMVKQNLVTQDKVCTIKVWRPIGNFECIYSQKLQNFSFCKINIFEKETVYLAVPQPESVIKIFLLEHEHIEFLSSCNPPEKSKNLGEVLHVKIFHGKCTSVAAIYESGALIIWNLQGTAIMSEKITSDTPMAFDFDSDNSQGICGTAGKSIIVFKLDENMKIIKRKIVEITNPGTGSLCVRHDKKIVAAGCWDGNVRIFSWKTCKLLAVLECHRESILYLNFSNYSTSTWNCKNILAVAASDRKVSLWNIYG